SRPLSPSNGDVIPRNEGTPPRGSSMHSERDKRKSQPIVGPWRGVVECPSVGFRREIFVTFSRKVGAEATADVPASRTFGLPLEKFECADETVRFAMPLSGSRWLHFDGNLAGDRIAGQVIGADVPGSFVLTRDDHRCHRSDRELSWEPVHRDYWPT